MADLTRRKVKDLKRELEHCQGTVRDEIEERIRSGGRVIPVGRSTAIAHSSLDEYLDYQAAREEQRKNDAKIQDLTNQLRWARVVEYWEPEEMILNAHPNARRLGARGPLPSYAVARGPGLLYVIHEQEGCVDAVLADSLRDAIEHLESAKNKGEMRRSQAYWVPGERQTLRDESPALRRITSAGRRSAPHKVKSPEDWKRVPAGGGVYRIYLFGEEGMKIDRVYVGRAGNFHDRPRRHPKIPLNLDSTQKWGVPGGVAKIALIYAKGEGIPGVWTSVDLDDLEARHIKRLQERHAGDSTEPRVINVTTGRNGPPSRSRTPHWFRWAPV